MDFNNTLPEWKNTGTEPSDTLKENGFSAGYKPPANIFNWFWNKVIAAITELQTNLSSVDNTLATVILEELANEDAVDAFMPNTSKVRFGKITSRSIDYIVVTGVQGSYVTQYRFYGNQTKICVRTKMWNDNNTYMWSSWAEIGDNAPFANIIKNPSDTTGDIISTHLTVGSRNAGTYGNSTFTSGVNHRADNPYSAIVGGRNNETTQVDDTENNVVIGGHDNQCVCSNAVIVGGHNNGCNGDNAIVLGGNNNSANPNQIKAGHYSKSGTAGEESGTTGDAFIIGNGTSSATANCFRVGYDGYVYGGKTFAANSADNAHFYEWLDGNSNNEDRRGLFVTLDGTKIRLATPEDTYIKGVVSAQPSFVSNAYSDNWQGMYLKDIFGAYLKDENGNYIINPDYDTSKEYIPRENRPEWDWVTNDGDIVLVDDGTCEVNGFATVGAGGKATKSDTKTDYRVMERKDDTHIYVSVR